VITAAELLQAVDLLLAGAVGPEDVGGAAIAIIGSAEMPALTWDLEGLARAENVGCAACVAGDPFSTPAAGFCLLL
jgi:hypothetical protein